MTDRIANPWGGRTPFGQHEERPVRVDQFLQDGVSEDEVDRWVQTASILHSNGDALDIAVKDGRMVGVRGRAVDRVNKGRLGPKDLFGWQANNFPDRLKKPLVRKDGELVEASWDEAFDLMVELLEVVNSCEGQTLTQIKWLKTRMKEAAPRPSSLRLRDRRGVPRRPQTLVERFGARSGEAVYTFFACLLALALTGLVAYASKQQTLLFPSLGPTALLFFEQPTAKPSGQRNAPIGHALAILAGAFCLALFGPLDAAAAQIFGHLFLAGASGELIAAMQPSPQAPSQTMLAGTMMPEAYEKGGAVVGVVATIGSLVAFVPSRLE